MAPRFGSLAIVAPRLSIMYLSLMKAPTLTPKPFEVWTGELGAPRYLHGTKTDLKPGDLIEANRTSNYGARKNAAFVYLTATLDAATWGAELAMVTALAASTSLIRQDQSKMTQI